MRGSVLAAHGRVPSSDHCSRSLRLRPRIASSYPASFVGRGSRVVRAIDSTAAIADDVRDAATAWLSLDTNQVFSTLKSVETSQPKPCDPLNLNF